MADDSGEVKETMNDVRNAAEALTKSYDAFGLIMNSDIEALQSAIEAYWATLAATMEKQFHEQA